jgi:putative DNA primase/helicase
MLKMKTETILFDTVTPHPGPVSLADLLTEIEAVINKHVILNPHAAAALAVWVLHTYTFELRDTVAYVAIESPEKRCGKTTLLSVLAAMAHRPLISSNITVGALFRAIHNCNPTLFIDEADTFLAGNGIMRGIINCGNTRRTAYVVRSSASNNSKLNIQNSSLPPAPATPDAGVKKYSCWCPKVIAMIGEAPDTISDRSIVVKMSRKLTTETCAPLAELESSALSFSHSGRSTFQTSDDNSPSPGGEGELASAEARGSKIPSIRQRTIVAEIRSKCARFALDAADSIQQHPKITGQGLNDRAADTFDPLYVIARHAGPDWEKKLHAAALALSATTDSENSGASLILDILDIFTETASEKMFSRDLVARLREGATASQTLKYSAINEYHISKILRQYHIHPSHVRIGKEVSRGYLATDFRDALKRYVSEADIQARVQEMNQRWKLQAEASAQAQKEIELRQQLMATVQKNGKLGPETWAILDQLNNMKQTGSAVSSPPTKDEELNAAGLKLT